MDEPTEEEIRTTIKVLQHVHGLFLTKLGAEDRGVYFRQLVKLKLAQINGVWVAVEDLLPRPEETQP
jgi:hypothetical protein